MTIIRWLLGRCVNCGHRVARWQRFCDRDCHDAWDTRQVGADPYG